MSEKQWGTSAKENRSQNVWTTQDKEDAGTFFRQMLDHSTRYLATALRDAHDAGKLSNEEFWMILCSQKEKEAGFYPPLAGPEMLRRRQAYPDHDPYSMLDFQACNKYLYYGAKGNTMPGGGMVQNDHRQDFYRYFGISNQENYRVILYKSIQLRNKYSHSDTLTFEEVDPDDLAEAIENVRMQTEPLSRRQGWCSRHPELGSLEEYWSRKQAEYQQRFGQPPVDFYALAQEVLMTTEDLTPVQESELFKVLQKMGLFHIEGHLIRGVDREMLRLVLTETLVKKESSENLARDLLQKVEKRQKERRLHDAQKRQAQEKAAREEKRRSETMQVCSRKFADHNELPVNKRSWVMDSQSLMQLRALTGRLLPIQPQVMDALLKNFTPMLDETLILTDEGLEFTDRYLIPSLKRLGRWAYVDESVVRTLFWTLRSTGKRDREEDDCQQRAVHNRYKRAIKALAYACREGCLQVSASPITSSHSYENIRWAAEFSDTVPFLVFTMDGSLAEELAQISGKNAVAFKVTREMDLLLWKACEPVYRQILSNAESGGENNGQQNGARHMPHSGDQVLCESPQGTAMLQLGRDLGEGGEGVIYEADAGGDLVAKIYHSGEDAADRYEKLKAMVGNNPNIDGLCWPVALLKNSAGEFVGYLMPRARGKELATTVFRPGRGCQRLSQNMGWTRRSLAQIAENIAAAFEQMHRKGILMGDVNPRNFLVSKECKVYLVDCDSYQFGSYSCPVGTDLYTPPEVHERIRAGLQKGFNYSRTEHNERYSLAVLLFEVIMLGKAPYVSRNNDAQDVVDAIIAGDFPYPFKDSSTGQTGRMAAPLGQWRDIWSHTTFKVKKQFYATFTKENNDRPSAAEWRETMAEYGRTIEKGYSSDELIPRGFKDVSQSGDEDVTAMIQVECERCHHIFTMAKDQYEVKKRRGEPILCSVDEGLRTMLRKMNREIQCSQCGKSFMGTSLDWVEQKNGKKIYCSDCAQVELKCSRCKRTYTVDRAAAQRVRERAPICPECRSSRSVATCQQCGTEFRIRPEKLAYLKSSKRQVLCPQCLERMLQEY